MRSDSKLGSANPQPAKYASEVNMIQTALGINGYGGMIGDGNTAEEYAAIAVALLRTG